jgi:hypothetical protein
MLTQVVLLKIDIVEPTSKWAGEIEIWMRSSASKPAVPVDSFVVRPKIDVSILGEKGP